jgi:hypothetical protein
MKLRGLSGEMVILDDVRLDARVYRSLEHHADVMASGIDVQGLLALAAIVFFEAEHASWCTCQGRPGGSRKPRATQGRKSARKAAAG